MVTKESTNIISQLKYLETFNVNIFAVIKWKIRVGTQFSGKKGVKNIISQLNIFRNVERENSCYF